MNKLSLFLFLSILTTSISAQTYYYKLTKKITESKTYTNTAGGQFITFMGQICYESNKKGLNVGNGQLNYEASLSENHKTYKGKSYFGENTYFKFNSDLSILNVYTANDVIYVYKRQAAPTGVTTCSLIKKQSTGGGGGTYYPVTPANPSIAGGGTYNGGTSTTGVNNSNNRSRNDYSNPRKVVSEQ